MINRVQIKLESKEHLKGSWKYPLQISLVSFVLSSLFNFKSTMSLITGIPLTETNEMYTWIWFWFSFLISVAGAFFYLSFVQKKDEANFQTFLNGFDHFVKASLTFLMLIIRLFAWSLLFIIPGIIKAFAYSQVTYIIADFPGISVNDAFKMSNIITRGYKLDIFVFYLSFIGWIFLSGISFGIVGIWVSPYIDIATTKLYLTLKKNAIEAGLIQVEKTKISAETANEENPID